MRKDRDEGSICLFSRLNLETFYLQTYWQTCLGALSGLQEDRRTKETFRKQKNGPSSLPPVVVFSSPKR